MRCQIPYPLINNIDHAARCRFIQLLCKSLDQLNRRTQIDGLVQIPAFHGHAGRRVVLKNRRVVHKGGQRANHRGYPVDQCRGIVCVCQIGRQRDRPASGSATRSASGFCDIVDNGIRLIGRPVIMNRHSPAICRKINCD